MTEGDGTTAGVELMIWDLELIFAAPPGLRSEGLVDLEDINVVNIQTSVLESFGDSVAGANSHKFWRNTSSGIADQTAVDFAAELLCDGALGQNNCSGTIGNLRGVSSSHIATLREGGLELGESLHCGLGADAIVSVSHNFSFIAVLINNSSMNRCNFFL